MHYSELLEDKEYEQILNPLIGFLTKAHDDIIAYFSSSENQNEIYPSQIIKHLDHLKETTIKARNLIHKSLHRRDAESWFAKSIRKPIVQSALLIFSKPDNDMEKQIQTSLQKIDQKIGDFGHVTVDNSNITQNLRWIDSKINEVLSFLQNYVGHYLGLQYIPIQSYRFSNQTLESAKKELENLETQYQATAQTGIVTNQPGDKIIINFSNGFCWVYLNRSKCREEADAMGHCGNAGAREGDRILSLRKYKKTKNGIRQYMPFLTFILDREGLLTEMKGTANTKPKAEYHKYIIELLKNPLIKGIGHGRWLIENDFKLRDLPTATLDKLQTDYPKLRDFGWHLKHSQGEELEEAVRIEMEDDAPRALREMYEEHFDITMHPKMVLEFLHYNFKGATYNEEDKVYYVKKWDNVVDFLEDFGNDAHAKEVATGEYFADFDYNVGKDDMRHLFEDLPLYYQMKLKEEAIGYLDEEDEQYDKDDLSTGEILEILYDSPNYDALTTAYTTGLEAGASHEAWESLQYALKKFEPTYGYMLFTRYGGDKNDKDIDCDGPVYHAFTKEEMKETLEEFAKDSSDDFDNLIEDTDDKIKDISPYQGYNDFDEYAAQERFMEDCTFDLIKPKIKLSKMSNQKMFTRIRSLQHKYGLKVTDKESSIKTDRNRLKQDLIKLYKRVYGVEIESA